MDITVNRTRLKADLLEHFQTSAVQEQFDGKNSLLPDCMHEMIKTASDYKSEALRIAKMAKEIREEMFAFQHFKLIFARVHLFRTVSSYEGTTACWLLLIHKRV